mmetsp:Transcript_82018/g.253469  ORF Transcript_82018/g.253469 Transcript_82018/m.253469 type:complete len:222 (+) Transcript_82018:424-1089(+)
MRRRGAGCQRVSGARRAPSRRSRGRLRRRRRERAGWGSRPRGCRSRLPSRRRRVERACGGGAPRRVSARAERARRSPGGGRCFRAAGVCPWAGCRGEPAALATRAGRAGSVVRRRGRAEVAQFLLPWYSAEHKGDTAATAAAAGAHGRGDGTLAAKRRHPGPARVHGAQESSCGAVREGIRRQWGRTEAGVTSAREPCCSQHSMHAVQEGLLRRGGFKHFQ